MGFRLLQLLLCCAALFSLVCGAPGAPCACTDEPPKDGLPCEDQRASGKCALATMKKGNYCSITCGFCKCEEEKAMALAPAGTEDCESCPDIPPPGDFTCEEQGALGKCVRGWMEGYCLRTCKKCSCDDPPAVATETMDPSVPDASEEVGTSAKTFENPTLDSGTTSQASQLDSNSTTVAEDGSTSSNLLSANLQRMTGDNVTQTIVEEPQVESNPSSSSTAVVEEDEAPQIQNNSTDTVPTGGVVEEGTQPGNKAAEIVPTSEEVVAPVQNNLSDNVPAIVEVATPVQNNSTDFVPTSEGVVAPVQNNLTDVPTSEEVVAPVNSTDVVPTSGEVAAPVQNNSSDTVPTIEEVVPPVNSTDVVPTGEEMDQGVPAQTNLTEAVPIAVEEAATENGAINKTVPEIEDSEDPIPATDVQTPSSPIANTESGEPETENNNYSPIQGINPTRVGSNRRPDGIDEDDGDLTGLEESIANSEIEIGEEEELDTVSVRPGCQTIMEKISRDENLSQLSNAVRVADIELALEDAAMDITFFAPTNAAFQMLNDLIGEGAAEILANPEVMKLVLSNHASRPGRTVDEILNAQSINTLSVVEGDRSELKFSRGPEGEVLVDGKINRAEIVTQDISACGGYLHIINAVLLPVDYSELKQAS